MAAVLEAQAGSERRRQRGAARPRGQAEGGTDKVHTVSGAEKEHGSSFEIECIRKFPMLQRSKQQQLLHKITVNNNWCVP